MSGFDEFSIVPTNPLEVCLPFANQMVRNPEFDIFRTDTAETQSLGEMNLALRILELIGEYRVIASLAFALPKDLPRQEERYVPNILRMDLETGFHGSLIGARSLKLGGLIDSHSVRAPCLAFEDARINYRVALVEGGTRAFVPPEEQITKDEQLYVPVFAIDQIHPAT